jgi:hypothetical protein
MSGLRRTHDRPGPHRVNSSARCECFGDDLAVSRRDLVRLLNALWRLSDGVPGVGVRVADLDGAIGHGDMRTPLNLQSLSDDGLAMRLPEGTWALTPEGITWLKQDRELSDR